MRLTPRITYRYSSKEPGLNTESDQNTSGVGPVEYAPPDPGGEGDDGNGTSDRVRWTENGAVADSGGAGVDV